MSARMSSLIGTITPIGRIVLVILPVVDCVVVVSVVVVAAFAVDVAVDVAIDVAIDVAVDVAVEGVIVLPSKFNGETGLDMISIVSVRDRAALAEV